MPKFPPNTGFKMPGIGSKEVNSPSNFREDHHVDKMGYCDTTPDDMLPSGSSPLKYTSSLDDDPYTSVRYTPGSLDASDAFKGKKPVKQELQDVQEGEGKQTPPTKVNTKNDTTSTVDETPKKSTNSTNTTRTKKVKVKAGKTNYSGGGSFKNKAEKDWYNDQISERTGKGMSQKEAVQDYRNTFKIGTKKTTPKTKTVVYKVNGKVVDKEAYQNAGPGANKTTEKK